MRIYFFFSDVFNLFNNLLLRDNLFRVRQNGSQSERPKVVVSSDDCDVGANAAYVDGDDNTDYVDDGDHVCGDDGGNNDNGKK